MKPFLRDVRTAVDVITWHFYPTESKRCPVAVRPASAERLASRGTLDEVAKWARKINALRDKYQPQAEVWMGESGSAQCGGQPGVSDRFGSSLWWLDELGTLARLGEKVVVRQALVGADYGLLAEGSFDPRPDYWASVLWKRVMGKRALSAAAIGASRVTKNLRVYAHCLATGDGAAGGGFGVLAINLSDRENVTIGADADVGYDVYLATSDQGLRGTEVRINGQVPRAGADGSIVGLEPHRGKGPLTLPPQSYAFTVFSSARVQACL